MADIVTRLRSEAKNFSMKDAHTLLEAAGQIERLREQVAHLSLYKPARRTEQNQEPVKAIGPCNFAFYGIEETDSEFSERAGAQIQEVEE